MKLTALKGISTARAREFEKLGITDTQELVRYFPRTYLDMTNRVSIRETVHGDMALVACTLVYAEPIRTKGKTKILRALLEQGRDNFTAVWFNMPYVAKKLQPGEYLFYGRVQNYYDRISLINPTFERVEESKKLQGLVPVYPLKAGVEQWVVRDAIRMALAGENFSSIVPEELRKKYKLSPLAEAFRAIHAPSSVSEMNAAAERIALEEYFTLISAFKLIKGDKGEARLRRYTATERTLPPSRSGFPSPSPAASRGR